MMGMEAGIARKGQYKKKKIETDTEREG